MPQFRRVCEAIVRHPGRVLLGALIVWALAGWAVTDLRFDTNFAALLPKGDPTVQEIEELRERAGGTVDLIIAIRNEGPVDAAKRLDFGRQLVEALRQQPWILRADVEFPVDFFRARQLWLVPLEQLEQMDTVLGEEIERAQARANPFFVDLEDDVAPWERVEEVFHSREGPRDDAFLRRTLTSKDNQYLFVRIKPRGTSVDIQGGKETMAQIRQVVAALDPQGQGLEIRYTGALPTIQEQDQWMRRDLQRAFIVALVLILLLLTVFTRRIWTPAVLVLPLLSGVLVTLGITALAVGQLNLVSGFLITALLGMGIDFGIHLYLRFLEHIDRGVARAEAMVLAMVRTIRGCVTAAVTTGAAFIAMTYSDFRGFREYGQIAAYGIVITLASTYLLLPPMALFFTRRPRQRAAGTVKKVWPPFRRSFAITLVSFGLCFAAYGVWVTPQIHFYNNFKKLQGDSPAVRFGAYVDQSLGGSMSPAIIAVHDVEEARRVQTLVQREVKDPAGKFDHHISLATMIPDPTEYAPRRALMANIVRRLDSVPLGELAEADQRRIDELREAAETLPWGYDDLPDVFLKLFTTLDGELNFVLAWPRDNMDVDRNILAWADALDRLQDEMGQLGISASILDTNRLAARVISKIKEDGPVVMVLAALAVILLISLDFRDPRRILQVLASLTVGFLWCLGLMRLLGIDLNVFNIAILPTILGLGIDNAAHLAHRYREEGPGSLSKVVDTTGRAALLGSLTTAIGFGAIVLAHHLGLRSMGLLAVVGFACVFSASTVFFPSLLRLFERKQARPNG